MLIDVARATVVFDLDDTLFYEDDYLESGVLAVAAELERLYGRDLSEELLAAKAAQADIWQCACDALALPESVKSSLLWLYRLHRPTISLAQPTQELLQRVRAQARHVAIITDGRSISQRQKLAALGLLHWPLYISEEYGSQKPEPRRFRQVMSDLPATHYVYIADNPQKDFRAPNQLGWLSFGLRAGVRNVHRQDEATLAPEDRPHHWLNNLAELAKLIRLNVSH